MSDYQALRNRLEDERDELKDCSRIRGEPSALDPFTAQRIANTMYEAVEAITALIHERDALRAPLAAIMERYHDPKLDCWFPADLAEDAIQALRPAKDTP